MPAVMRHPRPDVAEGVCYGQFDLPLHDGWQASMDAALALPFDAVISSPLTRCRQPAEWLAAQRGLVLELEPALMEMHFGEWEGLAWQAFDGPEARAWAADFVHTVVPGGESLAQMARRVRHAFRLACQRYTRPLLLSHAGPIRVLLADRAGTPLEQMFSQSIGYAKVYRLD